MEVGVQYKMGIAKLQIEKLLVEIHILKYQIVNIIQTLITKLGVGAIAQDHGAVATDQIINVCYGTGDPPAANTTTIGTLFVKYTA